MARRKAICVANGKDAATVQVFADFHEAHGFIREAVTTLESTGSGVQSVI